MISSASCGDWPSYHEPDIWADPSSLSQLLITLHQTYSGGINRNWAQEQAARATFYLLWGALETVIILKLLLIDPTGKLWAHFPSGLPIYNILRHPTLAWECLYQTSPSLPDQSSLSRGSSAGLFTALPSLNWYSLSIHKALITYTWVILHIPSGAQAVTGSPTKSSLLPVYNRWRWGVGFLIKLSELVVPVISVPPRLFSRNSLDSSRLLRLWSRARRLSPGDGSGRRLPGDESDGGSTWRLGTRRRRRHWLPATCTQPELGLIYRFIVWTSLSRGAGWHLYIRSEHNMSRNDPEITWVKMCLTSQFMNWRHETHETKSQNLWSHCHDLGRSEIGHPDCANTRILKQSEMFVKNHSPAVYMTCVKSPSLSRDAGLICLNVSSWQLFMSGPACPTQASPINAEKYRLAFTGVPA